MIAAVLVALVRLAAFTVRLLPARLCDAVGACAGTAWYALVPVRRDVARRNVARAFPDWDARRREALVRAHFAHLGRSFLELLRFARQPADLASVALEGREHLARALERGAGVLVLSAHVGNFELLVRLATATGAPAGIVTRRFSWAPAERVWRALRADGPTLLPAGRSARKALAILRCRGVVAFVLDQHSTARRAVRVPFFGAPAATSPDLVRLARLSGAPIVPVFTRREDHRHVVRIEPPVELTGDLVADTALCTARIEAAIREAPEQWLWIHRRWKP